MEEDRAKREEIERKTRDRERAIEAAEGGKGKAKGTGKVDTWLAENPNRPLAVRRCTAEETGEKEEKRKRRRPERRARESVGKRARRARTGPRTSKNPAKE